MITFDNIVNIVRDEFTKKATEISAMGAIAINRDLNGRVRLIVDERWKDDTEKQCHLNDLLGSLIPKLKPHCWSVDKSVLYEKDVQAACLGAPQYNLEGFPEVFVVDRLATETDWASIQPASIRSPRVVFFSIKGGVGRSSALAASAWSLAQSGKKVLILDLDLESPGLSTALLPESKQPNFGITDWLLEDLVDNGNAVIQSMVATSDLSHDGQIYVVPAHGAEPGEYISKLSRIWMPKLKSDGTKEAWSKRLHRLIDELETSYQPDVILIDSRAGIDEVAASCVTELGAKLILLFAVDGNQTWNGYRILFEHWCRAGVIQTIRERFQVVSALTPDVDTIPYIERLRDRAYNLMAETQYDDIPAGELASNAWNFEVSDETAPHNPWVVHWHRSFAGVSSLHGRILSIDSVVVQSIFGDLVNGLSNTISEEVDE